MTPLTERQREYLLLFAQRDRQDKCISEAAETFHVSKPAAFSVAELLRDQGMLLKGKNGEVWLTDRGWKQISRELSHQQRLMVWLTSGLGMTPDKAEREARHMAVFLAPEVLDGILALWQPTEVAGTPDWPEAVRKLKPGRYEVPFLVCKKDRREVSMGGRGFQKPAVLALEEGRYTLRLYPKSIQYRPESGKRLSGSLDRMWYQTGGVWHEALRDEDGARSLPGGAIRMENGPEGLVGIVRIRARASVGILGMPESEADIRFDFQRLRPASGAVRPNENLA